MPRYALDAQTLADLTAFLRQRGSAPPPGVDDRTLHLASVVTPQAPPGRRAAVLQAMQAWSAGLRLGTREVMWHRWQLDGPPANWPAQLDALWAAQPVYALLSGAGGDDWAPVQTLCETRGLPCLMPVLDQPPADPGDPDHGRHWSLYLHGGPAAEARLLAQQLRSLPQLMPFVPGVSLTQRLTTRVGFALGDGLRRWAGTPSTLLPALPGSSPKVIAPSANGLTRSPDRPSVT